MKFTKIPTNTFQNIQLNAGILVSAFTPATGAFTQENMLGATSGGVNFTATPTFVDFGEDIDNCPKNMKELKKLDSWEVKMTGTFASVNTTLSKKLIGAADISGDKITPRVDITTADFADLWWIGDYSDQNGETNGGYVAIHMINALSTGGFQIQSTDKSKGQFAFEFTGHVSMNAQSVVPFEVYVKSGTAESGAYTMNVTSVAGTTSGKTAITTSETKTSSESYVYQTGHNIYAPAQGEILEGTAWTSWDGSAEITAATGLEIIVAIIDTTTKASAHAGKAYVTAHE